MNQTTSSLDLNKIEYQFKQIDNSPQAFNTSQISNNEQYLAYGGQDRIFKIYDIKQDKLVRENLFLMLVLGNVNFHLIHLNYLLAYLADTYMALIKEIHNINKMIIIKSQYLITCSYDDTIRKTDFRSKKQIFKFIGHTELITTIDYNQIDDILISGSYDQSMKLWRCDNRSIIINKQDLSTIMQLQLINNNQNVLSLDYYGVLQKWKIDLIKRDLIKIKEFNVPGSRKNFCQVNNGQNLLLICEQYFKILNDQGEIIHQQNHGAGKIYPGNQGDQLDNLRYIHIQSEKTIMLATAKTK